MTEVPAAFLGFDHVDARVPSLAAVEAFYDLLMPLLGLPRRRNAYVDDAGDWHDAKDDGSYNAVEYIENAASGRAPCFMGIIERPETPQTLTRIAVRVPPERLETLHARLKEIGARHVEPSAGYPDVRALDLAHEALLRPGPVAGAIAGCTELSIAFAEPKQAPIEVVDPLGAHATATYDVALGLRPLPPLG